MWMEYIITPSTTLIINVIALFFTTRAMYIHTCYYNNNIKLYPSIPLSSFARCCYIGFLGRLLLATSKTNRSRYGAEAKEGHQLHHTSDHRRKAAINGRSASHERSSNYVRSRMTLTTVPTPDVYAGPACEVLDHSEQWHLAASILDRFFLVTYSIAILCLTIWTGVRIS